MRAFCHTSKSPLGFPIDLLEWPNQVREPVMRGEGYVGKCPCCEKKIVIVLPGTSPTQQAMDTLK